MIENSTESASNLDKKHLPLLYVFQREFEEVRDYINSLKNLENYKLDVREATTIQKALNDSLIVSYFRNMKKSDHFYEEHKIRKLLKLSFSKEELILHKKLEDLRDKEVAHSDGEQHDVRIYLEKEEIENEEQDSKEEIKPDYIEIISTHSMVPLRQPLEPGELDMLTDMVHKIRTKVDDVIAELTENSEER